MSNKKELGYELRIGREYNYFEFGDETLYPCKLINIINDGRYVLYEFMHDNTNGSCGATIYPEKLKPRK